MRIEDLQFTEQEIGRFWAKVDKAPGFGPWGDCWKWTAALSQRTWGYGRFGTRRKGQRRLHGAHVLSYMLAGHEKPDRLNVLHTCDTPECVNPEHLCVGSHAANTADMIVKGRHSFGRRGARFEAESGVHFRLAEIAVRQGVGLPQLTEETGLPAPLLESLWYSRARFIPLGVLDKLSDVLGVEPGTFFKKAA